MKWIRDFLNQDFPPEMNKFAGRLKSSFIDGADMERVCAELEEKINPTEYPSGREVVLEVAIDSAAACEKKREVYEGPSGKKEIEGAKKKVVKKIENLIESLNELEAMQVKGPMASKADVSPERLIIKAGMRMTGTAKGRFFEKKTILPGRDRRDFFREEITPVFGELSKRLENKIAGGMPTIQETLEALKTEIKKIPLVFKDRLTRYSFKSRKATTADFTRVFLHEINTQCVLGTLPSGFMISAETVGMLAGILFELDAGISDEAIKKAWNSKLKEG